MSETDPLVSAPDKGSPKGVAMTTEEIRTLVRKNINIGKAAFLLRDVITEGGAVDSNFSYNPYEDECGAMSILISIVCRKILSRTLVHNTVQAIGWILVILSFIEEPQWCRKMEGGCSNILSLRGPPAFGDETDVQYYPNFGISWLSTGDSYTIELICSTILVIFVLLLIGRDGLDISKFLQVSFVRKYRLVLTLCVILQWVGLVFYGMNGFYSTCALYIRLIILTCLNGKLQRELSHFIAVVPKLWNFLFILLLVITFYSWIGNTIFLGSDEGKEHFPTLVEGMFTLWICFTTANYPDVMMPAFNKHSLANAFFVTYMIIAYFFIMNIILSQVLSTYSNCEGSYDEKRDKNKKQKNSDAYDLLDPNGHGFVEKSDFMSIFTVLNNDCPEVRTFTDEETEIFFLVLDKDSKNRNKMDRDEFLRVTEVMCLEFDKVESKKTFVEALCPGLYNSDTYKSFSNVISSNTFEAVIDGIVFLNAVLVFIQSYPQLSGQVLEIDEKFMDSSVDTLWEVGETIFTIIYCLEMSCKILVFGSKKYWAEYRNIFDGTITILALASTIYVYYPNQFSNALLIRYVVMGRVLRLVRLLVAIPQFALTGRIFLKLIPRGLRVALLLFSFMYLFSAFAMQRFGGIITRDPNNPIALTLEGTDFAGAEYWENSFNDMMSGMNVMFNLLVINNWTQEADGIVAASGSRLSRFLFIAFHLVGVLILNNIVLSTVISTFLAEYDKIESGHDSDPTFNASLITGADGELDGEYRVKVRQGNMRQSVINKLISPA